MLKSIYDAICLQNVVQIPQMILQLNLHHEHDGKWYHLSKYKKFEPMSNAWRAGHLRTYSHP